MKEEIEKAIRETLVISNPTSIPIAVKKIMKLIDEKPPTPKNNRSSQ